MRCMPTFELMHTLFLSPQRYSELQKEFPLLSLSVATASTLFRHGFRPFDTLTEWLTFFEELELTHPLYAFGFHLFALQCARGDFKSKAPLSELYGAPAKSETSATSHRGFAEPLTLALLAGYTGAKAHLGDDVPDSETLNAWHLAARQYYHPYRVKTSAERVGLLHLTQAVLKAYAQRSAVTLHPLLVNACKALWNDSVTLHFELQQVLTALPEDEYGLFRALYDTFIHGQKSESLARRSQEAFNSRWHHRSSDMARPLEMTQSVQKHLQNLLKKGPVHQVQCFLRADEHGVFEPLDIPLVAHGFRRENHLWCWRSTADFSTQNSADALQLAAQQNLEQRTRQVFSNSVSVPPLWIYAGEAVFVALIEGLKTEALKTGSLSQAVQDISQRGCSPFLFYDACERLACPARMGQTEILGQHLSEIPELVTIARYCLDERARTQRLQYHEENHDVNHDLQWTEIERALRAFGAFWESKPLPDIPAVQHYLTLADRQMKGPAVHGFFQPLFYAGTEAVAVMSGQVSSAFTPVVLPFVTRCHMFAPGAPAHLLRYWAEHQLIHWQKHSRQELFRRQQDYDRIREAFETVRYHREQEQQAWTHLQNQLDPPTLKSYGILSNYALQQAYLRLHRPQHIDHPAQWWCFLAELASGRVVAPEAAHRILERLANQQPHCFLSEMYSYAQKVELTPSRLQALFSWCKMQVYDGSQVESRLPGRLTLAQWVYTLRRVQRHFEMRSRQLHKKISAPVSFQGALSLDLNTLSLGRLLRKPELQRKLLGCTFDQIQDTHHIVPGFRLSQEALPIDVCDALFHFLTVHFSPTLPEPAVRWQQLELYLSDEELVMSLYCKGRFSDAALHKLSELSDESTEASDTLNSSAHDLRHQMRRWKNLTGQLPVFEMGSRGLCWQQRFLLYP